MRMIRLRTSLFVLHSHVHSESSPHTTERHFVSFSENLRREADERRLQVNMRGVRYFSNKMKIVLHSEHSLLAARTETIASIKETDTSYR